MSGSGFGSLGHLAFRFATSLDPRGPDPQAENWALSWLSPEERSLWRLMSGQDRRHAISVAGRTLAIVGSGQPRAVVAAALLHDVGKVASRVGTLGRSVITAAALVAGRDALTRAPEPPARDWGRAARLYLAHDRLGAHLLQQIGSDPLTWRWALEHHLSPDRWTLPTHLANALKAADGD